MKKPGLFDLAKILKKICGLHYWLGIWEGRGNPWIQLVCQGFCTVNCCPTATNYQSFPLEVGPGFEPRPQKLGGQSVTTLPLWPYIWFLQGLQFFLPSCPPPAPPPHSNLGHRTIRKIQKVLHPLLCMKHLTKTSYANLFMTKIIKEQEHSKNTYICQTL